MKFVSVRPFSEPDAAARRPMEIANAAEAVQDGRIHIELINAPSSMLGAQFATASCLIRRIGMVWRSNSGRPERTFRKVGQSGAENVM
jgi:hypothetical protein